MGTYRLLIGALLLSGCLVSDDIANVDLSTLQKPFTIDAAAWTLNSPAATRLLGSTCNPDALPDPCAQLVVSTNVCKLAVCTSSCNAETSRCEMTLRTELWRTVNLMNELPELVAAAQDDPEFEIMLDDVTYEVARNSFNVDVEGLTLYVARSTVTNPADGATPLGTLRPIFAGETDARRSIDFFPDGKEMLRRRLSDYQVPFNLLLGTTLTVTSAATLPTGSLETLVTPEGRVGSN